MRLDRLKAFAATLYLDSILVVEAADKAAAVLP
jgi:hypothetical protein